LIPARADGRSQHAFLGTSICCTHENIAIAFLDP
jgi:hypothetical protein